MKKLLSLALCAAFLLSFLAPCALAAGSVFTVRTTGDWEALAEACVLDRWSEEKEVVLAGDLDFTGLEFTPIPLFSGHFDGNGHTIRGIDLEKDASTVGVFRQVLEGAVVENLTVSGLFAPGGKAEYVGGIAGKNSGTIRDCIFEGTVRASRCVGGLVGANMGSGILRACTVSGTVQGQHRVGGAAGENEGTIEQCVSRASVNPEAPASIEPEKLDLTLTAEEIIDITDVGGIAGNSAGAVRQCRNEGGVGYPRVGYNIGGIVGHQSGLTEGCISGGAVYGRKDVGGIIGQMDPDGGWNFTEGNLAALETKLDDLQESINTLLSDTGKENRQVSGKLNTVLEALSRTGNAAEALTDETSAWVNANIDTINDFLSRVSETLDNLAPVCRELDDFTSYLPDAFGALHDAFLTLGDALELAGGGMAELSPAITDFNSAMADASLASGEIAAGIEHLDRGLGDERQVQLALSEISGGLSDLSEMIYLSVDDVRTLASLLENGTGEEDPEIRQVWIDYLRALGTSLASLASHLVSSADAFSEFAGGAGDLIAEPNIAELRNFLESLGTSFSYIGQTLNGLQSANLSLQDSLETFEAAGQTFAKAMDETANAADAMEKAFSALHRASTGFADAIDTLSAHPTLAFTPINTESEAKSALFASLRDANAALGSLSGQLADTALLDDIQAISDRMFDLTDFILAALSGGKTAKGRFIEDISAGAPLRTRGAVENCANHGAVEAETNVGGIVGAISIELSFDQEDELDLSSLLAGGAKYLIYAAVRGCDASASVRARKSAAGGIVGRMDYGAVSSCACSGSIEAQGDYAGGIAGISLGTIHACRARVNLSAGNYVGGIAGSGHDLSSCLAMPYLAEPAEFQGSIAGFADGKIEENYYCENRTGGVDGFSFSGQAEQIEYSALLEKSGADPIFQVITVTFVADGETVETRTVSFGGAVGEAPAVPDKDGMRWKWDAYDQGEVFRSMTVEGSYVRPLTALSSGEEIPRVLIEGTFGEGQALNLAPYIPAADFAEGEILDAGTLSVPGSEEALNVRLHAEEAGTLYLVDRTGVLTETTYTRDGTYIVFPMENGASFVYVRAKITQRLLVPILIAAAAAVILVLILVFYIRRKSKKAKH
ncbi:MAG: methyl-accepting chemotaxis protein [Oscillospiraceae bacterium]|nr:methyl-accepting chemotaxis protein [Oscillospiraceae bacterium]